MDRVYANNVINLDAIRIEVEKPNHATINSLKARAYYSDGVLTINLRGSVTSTSNDDIPLCSLYFPGLIFSKIDADIISEDSYNKAFLIAALDPGDNVHPITGFITAYPPGQRLSLFIKMPSGGVDGDTVLFNDNIIIPLNKEVITQAD
jgi:hypothetical protein